MLGENLLINLLALNAHFCNSPMSMNRKYDKFPVEKNDLTEEESSHAAFLSSLLKIREQQWWIPNFDRNEIEMMVEFICTAWSRLSMMYSLEQMSWFFLYYLFCMGLMCPNKLINWIHKHIYQGMPGVPCINSLNHHRSRGMGKQSHHFKSMGCNLSLCYAWMSNYIQHNEGVLQKGLYLPCVSMAGRALWDGYHRWLIYANIDLYPCPNLNHSLFIMDDSLLVWFHIESVKTTAM